MHPTEVFGFALWGAEQAFCGSLRALPVNPQLFRVKATQRDDLGKVIYANSITLTPGTVTVDIDGDEFLVHALSDSTKDDLETGEMDRRVTALEGSS